MSNKMYSNSKINAGSPYSKLPEHLKMCNTNQINKTMEDKKTAIEQELGLTADKIALIMMATFKGKCSPALFGIPLERVYEFMEQPETSGLGRYGHPWFLCFTGLDDYCNDFKSVDWVAYKEDSGKQDNVLKRLGLPKYDIFKLIELMGRKPKLIK